MSVPKKQKKNGREGGEGEGSVGHTTSLVMLQKTEEKVTMFKNGGDKAPIISTGPRMSPTVSS